MLRKKGRREANGGTCQKRESVWQLSDTIPAPESGGCSRRPCTIPRESTSACICFARTRKSWRADRHSSRTRANHITGASLRLEADVIHLVQSTCSYSLSLSLLSLCSSAYQQFGPQSHYTDRSERYARERLFDYIHQVCICIFIDADIICGSSAGLNPVTQRVPSRSFRPPPVATAGSGYVRGPRGLPTTDSPPSHLKGIKIHFADNNKKRGARNMTPNHASA